jgi:hypothetical protein
MGNTDKVDFGVIVQEIRDLNPEDFDNLLCAMSNLKAIREQQAQEPDIEVSDELPCLKIPSELLLPALEFLFMAFIRELGNNMEDDYQTSLFNKLTNNNSMIVSTYYDETQAKEGQFPQIAVKCEGMSMSSQYLGDVAAGGGSGLSFLGGETSSGALTNFNMRFDIFSRNDTEVDILGSLITMALGANLDILRQVFNLHQITYPSYVSAQKVREYGMVFMGTINFTCLKWVNWTESIRMKTYKNVIHRIVAYASDRGAICAPLVQLIVDSGVPIEQTILDAIAERGL